MHVYIAIQPRKRMKVRQRMRAWTHAMNAYNKYYVCKRSRTYSSAYTTRQAHRCRSETGQYHIFLERDVKYEAYGLPIQFL